MQKVASSYFAKHSTHLSREITAAKRRLSRTTRRQEAAMEALALVAIGAKGIVTEIIFGSG